MNSPHERFAALTARIAVTPNIIRARREDALRAERSVVDFDKRVESAIAKIEKDVRELEKALV